MDASRLDHGQSGRVRRAHHSCEATLRTAQAAGGLRCDRERGAALPVVLVLLPVITLLALSATQVSRAGLRAAVNEELRVQSFVTAQSAVEAVIADPASTPVVSGDDHLYCTPGAGCDQALIDLPAELAATQAGTLEVQVRRLEPELAPPPRGAGASLTRFYAAAFSVRATHDATGSGYGRTEIDEGLILVLPYL